MASQPASLDTIVCAAVEIDAAGERDAYIAGACGGDAELRARVEKLVAAHFRAGRFLEKPALAAGDTAEHPPPTGTSAVEHPGAVVGRYRLQELIGEGGMGSVWMAEQTEPVRRKVALKVIKPGMDSGQVIARFEAERQALALMDHPNIARVLDAGTTAGEPGGVSPGRPYFVMELVKGIPITDFCDRQQLTPRERLGLFVSVCRAVQHAHQKGIIHRDVKPSNVLVTLHDGTPVVKVIDFGIAKATGEQLTEKTLFTGFTQLLGTPLYMSPEQAELSGLDVDTRSDIYSLGVLLYELLTGTTPFERERLRRAGFDEMRRIIREEEPPRPSARISTLAQTATAIAAQRRSDPKRLGQFLRGDLDWVVMKALAKDRNGRYATAKELGDDVECFLEDRPVQARPPTLGDRVRKWARRHRTLVRTSAALLALAVAALAIGAGVLRAKNVELAGANEQERAARQQADANLLAAKEAVDTYLNEVTEDQALKNRKDFHALRRKLLTSAVAFYEQFVREEYTEERMEAARGRAYGRLANVRGELGQHREALAGFEQMRVIFSRLAADFPANAEYRKQLAVSHNDRAVHLSILGRIQEALAANQEALTLQKGLVEDFPDSPDFRDDLAATYHNRGRELSILGRADEALAAFEESLALQQKLVADFPRRALFRQKLAGNHNDRGLILIARGRHEAALAEFEAAIRLQERLVADYPVIAEYRHLLGMSYNNRAIRLHQLRRPKEALATFRKDRDLKAKLAGDFPTIPEYRRSLAVNYLNQANLLRDLARPADAEASIRDAVEVYDKLVSDFPAIPDYRLERAVARGNHGIMLLGLRRLGEALAATESAASLLEKLAADFPGVPAYAVELGKTCTHLAEILQVAGRTKTTLRWYAKAIRTLEPVVAADTGNAPARRALRFAFHARARALTRRTRYAEALKDWEQALALEQGPERGLLRLERAACLVLAGQPARAFAEVNALTAGKNVPADLSYNAACVCALAAAAVKSNGPLTDQYAGRAVALLRQAVAAGFKDLEHLRSDRDLASLRTRKDFQALRVELEAKRPK